MKRFIDLKGLDERSITSSIAKNNLDESDKIKAGQAKKNAERTQLVKNENN